jgi:hypothetical protein
VADGIAIISVVASSTVALAAVAAQIWQGRLNRENEGRAWLRDRRAEAYISVLRLFVKTSDQVAQSEWEELTARVTAFASPALGSLFKEWSDATAKASQPDVTPEAFQQAYQESLSLQRRIEAQVAAELQPRTT